MEKENKTWKRVFFILIGLGLVCMALGYFYQKAENSKSPAHGNWKITRVIWQTSGYGDEPMGSDIGRSFHISGKKIVDSEPESVAIRQGKYTKNMDVEKQEDYYLEGNGGGGTRNLSDSD